MAILPRAKKVPTPSPLVASISIGALGGFIAVLMCGLMLYTYHTCVAQGTNKACKPLPSLPTISQTWEEAPGNYLPVYVSYVSVALALVQFPLFHAIKSRFTPQITQVMLISQLVGCVGLSVVGAVCDADHDPQCMGDNTVHVIGAVLFFLSYNLCIGNIVGSEPNNLRGRFSKFMCYFIVVIMTISKLRYIPQVADWLVDMYGDETPLAVGEWTDVFFIIGWTAVTCIGYRKGYRIGVARDATQTPAKKTVMSVSVLTLTGAFATILAITPVLTLIVNEAMGTVPTQFPTISDLYVAFPNNLISRWALPMAANIGTLSHYALCGLDTKGAGTAGKVVDFGLMALAVASLGSMKWVGAVNEKEDEDLHASVLSLFYLTFDAYMVGRTARHIAVRAYNSEKRHVPSIPHIAVSGIISAASVALITCLYFIPTPLEGVSAAAADWGQAFLILLFSVVETASYGAAAKNAALQIVCEQITEEPSKTRRAAVPVAVVVQGPKKNLSLKQQELALLAFK